MLKGTEPAEINLVLDGTQANISKNILDAMQAIMANYSARYVGERRLNRVGPFDAKGRPFKLNKKVINNPELSPSVFLIPGILAIIMHMMTILFTSFSIVRERESGTLEQLMVSPILVSDLMVGKVLPYAAIGLFDMLLTLGLWSFSSIFRFQEVSGFCCWLPPCLLLPL